MSNKDLAVQLELAEQVASLYLQGYSNREISKQLSLTGKETTQLLEGWKNILRKEAQSATQIKDRVLDILIEADAAWSKINKEAWNTVEQADQQGMLGQKIAALKLAEQVTKNRNQAFSSAGINQDTDLIDEMNETQRKQDILIGILREIKTKYPEVSEYLAKRLTDVTNEVEVIQVEKNE